MCQLPGWDSHPPRTPGSQAFPSGLASLGHRPSSHITCLHPPEGGGRPWGFSCSVLKCIGFFSCLVFCWLCLCGQLEDGTPAPAIWLFYARCPTAQENLDH